jgi:hypothetical protein
MDDLGKVDSKSAEGKVPEIKAEDNPWYLLATLYVWLSGTGIGSPGIGTLPQISTRKRERSLSKKSDILRKN